jgi:hypothetical protein
VFPTKYSAVSTPRQCIPVFMPPKGTAPFAKLIGPSTIGPCGTGRSARLLLFLPAQLRFYLQVLTTLAFKFRSTHTPTPLL